MNKLLEINRELRDIPDPQLSMPISSDIYCIF